MPSRGLKKLVEIAISSPEQSVLGQLAMQRVQAEQAIIRSCDDIAVSRAHDLKDKDIQWVVDEGKITAYEKPDKKGA